jgi:hypothetical protein
VACEVFAGLPARVVKMVVRKVFAVLLVFVASRVFAAFAA